MIATEDTGHYTHAYRHLVRKNSESAMVVGLILMTHAG